MPRGVCMGCVIPVSLRWGCKGASGLDTAGHARGGADLFGDLIGFFGVEIHGDFHASGFDEQADHPVVCRADLQIGFDIALAVDTHGRLAVGESRGASLTWVEWQAGLRSDFHMENVILRPFRSDDTDWLVMQHGTLYAQFDGFDDTFGPLVRQIIDEFNAGHDPEHERGWIAEQDGTRLGSIFCVRAGPTTAKLRLFLLIPQARGLGLGKRLLATCVEFARASGYSEMELWTHESHKAACALYRATGWQLEASRPVRSFGVDLVEQSWRRQL